MIGDIITLNGVRYRIVSRELATGRTAKGVAYQFTAVGVVPA